MPAIVAAAVALNSMLEDQKVWAQRKETVRARRDLILGIISQNIPNIVVNGDPQHGLYNILSVSLPGGSASEIAKRLDEEGISVGSGSACNKGKVSESMLSMGRSVDMIRGTLRISLSELNSLSDCREIASAVIRIWRSLKN